MNAVLEQTHRPTAKPPISPEEFLRMAETHGFELVEGELEERDVSLLSSLVSRRISTLLGNHADPLKAGWVLESEAQYRCFTDHPDWVRRADVSFISITRYSAETAMKGGFITIAPDLAVEVLSPNDLASEVGAKVSLYLRAGVKTVWVVDPLARTVHVHRKVGQGTILHEQDEIEAAPALPGFRCKVADFFIMLPEVAG